MVYHDNRENLRSRNEPSALAHLPVRRQVHRFNTMLYY